MVTNIKTNLPIYKDKIKAMHLVSSFWDNVSLGWQKIWGPHIHHGFYDETKSTPLEAQEKLMVKLAQLLDIQPKAQILDVGCGMGSSAFYLAKNFNANVSGITLSQKQVSIAQRAADQQNVKNVNFKIEDALSLASFKDNTFDIAWSLESCEQFFDKQQFIKQVERKLKLGGKLMLATWCSDQEEYSEQLAKRYRKLCIAFDLPYMPTSTHYTELLLAQGFKIHHNLDWSHQVKESWEVGTSLLQALSLLRIIKIGGLRAWRFVNSVSIMRDAFNDGNVKYCVFVAEKITNFST
ncbi:MAG: methyltransferase domain-containing protein [Gammaproteobacteria bacterium]|nr:methyltransferase domain-containing protein [Gammaproteobacteria bacterium]